MRAFLISLAMKLIKLIFSCIVLGTAIAYRDEFKYSEVDLKGSCPKIKYITNLSMSRIVGWYCQASSSVDNSLCFNNEEHALYVASFDNRTLSVQHCSRRPADPDVAKCGSRDGSGIVTSANNRDDVFYKISTDDNDLLVLDTNYNDLTIAYGCKQSCRGSGREEIILILSRDYKLNPTLENRARSVLKNYGIKFSNAKIVKQCHTKVIQEASTEEEIIACLPVITELLPHIKCKNELVKKVKLQNEQGYRLMFIKDKETNKVASICGFRIAHSLLTGKTLYIDDLCTLPFARGI